MSEDKIKKYDTLMKAKEYKKAGEIVFENFFELPELTDIAIKYHQKILSSKDEKNKKLYEEQTPGELIVLLESDYK
ncbi:hypothetical protein KY304_01280 [Candidatus Woesearchaeota archaeon]|nr:hypothetical protein [Candidatus Woesearchaeota archaeon]MBW2978725.1 hypothetical protein [Candidatus Woesearchaeota archaeon]